MTWPRSLLVVALAAAAAVTAAACDDEENQEPRVGFGNPEAGARLIDRFGCGSCHTIPGIEGADALVGPPLTHWADRAYIAGALVNTPDNLVLWITEPDEVEPGTAMPDLGVSPVQARDIAAYLFTID